MCVYFRFGTSAIFAACCVIVSAGIFPAWNIYRAEKFQFLSYTTLFRKCLTKAIAERIYLLFICSTNLTRNCLQNGNFNEIIGRDACIITFQEFRAWKRITILSLPRRPSLKWIIISSPKKLVLFAREQLRRAAIDVTDVLRLVKGQRLKAKGAYLVGNNTRIYTRDNRLAGATRGIFARENQKRPRGKIVLCTREMQIYLRRVIRRISFRLIGLIYVGERGSSRAICSRIHRILLFGEKKNKNAKQ